MRLKAEWCAAYSEHFINVAVGRGWQRADAETWPEHIVDEAFIETYKHHDCDPQKTAALDVIAACEGRGELIQFCEHAFQAWVDRFSTRRGAAAHGSHGEFDIAAIDMAKFRTPRETSGARESEAACLTCS